MGIEWVHNRTREGNRLTYHESTIPPNTGVSIHIVPHYEMAKGKGQSRDAPGNATTNFDLTATTETPPKTRRPSVSFLLFIGKDRKPSIDDYDMIRVLPLDGRMTNKKVTGSYEGRDDVNTCSISETELHV